MCDFFSRHTFVICAYKNSPYIEECICSLKQQTKSSIILLATSTPSDYLESLCMKYKIEYHVRNGVSNIADDWNYAWSIVKTPYVTIAHQDDIYEKSYTEKIMKEAEGVTKLNKEICIFFTDYSEMINGKKYKKRKNLKIKKILLSPLKKINRQDKKFWKKFSICFGNAICCPTVTYNKDYIDKLAIKENRERIFNKYFRSNLDWETWEWLSNYDGRFVYLPSYLMAHRIHEESETSSVIHDNQRGKEDYEMFSKFWPKWIAKILTHLYSESEKSNEI